MFCFCFFCFFSLWRIWIYLYRYLRLISFWNEMKRKVSTHSGRVFFEVIRWRVTSFQMIAGSVFKLIWNMLCLCHDGPALLTFSFQTDLGRENSASYLKMQAGKTDAFHFSHHSRALATLHVQFLCYDWSTFDRWVYADNLCSILRLVYFASRSWLSFVSTCDVRF